jgi:hypothetical protein
MVKKISIGHGVDKKYSGIVATEPITTEQRISILEAKLEAIIVAVTVLQLLDKPITNHQNAYEGTENPNKDGLPIGLMLVGTSKSINHILMVEELEYSIVSMFEGPPISFPSLSAAAEAVSGVRRSGWAFWKLEDGRSVKDVFRKV